MTSQNFEFYLLDLLKEVKNSKAIDYEAEFVAIPTTRSQPLAEKREMYSEIFRNECDFQLFNIKKILKKSRSFTKPNVCLLNIDLHC